MTRPPAFLDLVWLAEHSADITDARLKGTPRTWMQVMGLDKLAQAQNDLLARIERAERTPLAIGEHPAPLHIDVLDLLVDLLATADDLAEKVAQAAGVERMPHVASIESDPEPYLRHAAAHLASAMMVDQQLGEYVEEEARRLRYEVAKHLGEFVYGQRLLARCPWCGGGTDRGYTLRVREVHGEPAVVCESGVCEPPESDVGTWHRGNPAWPLSREGEWLADRISRVEEQRKMDAA